MFSVKTFFALVSVMTILFAHGQQCGDERSIASSPIGTNSCFNETACFNEVADESEHQIDTEEYKCITTAFFGNTYCFRRSLLRGKRRTTGTTDPDCRKCIELNGYTYCKFYKFCSRRRLDNFNKERKLSGPPMANDTQAFLDDLNDPCWVDLGQDFDTAFDETVDSYVTNAKKTTVDYEVQQYSCGC